ncbi:MAG: 30S ribosomal protein S11 [Bdellovibrionaceae bacterium]|nr:30S ribosomal protein S11 [Pseudobdellovibrionaceae bacterium]
MAENTKQNAKPAKKKTKKNIPSGKCYIQAGYGNTIITITDVMGNAISWSASGKMGFKGSRKGTPFASQLAAEDAAKQAIEQGVRSVDVFLNGPGQGRESAIRALASAGIRVNSMRDTTPVPHNGCRPPKRRRV